MIKNKIILEWIVSVIQRVYGISVRVSDIVYITDKDQLVYLCVRSMSGNADSSYLLHEMYLNDVSVRMQAEEKYLQVGLYRNDDLLASCEFSYLTLAKGKRYAPAGYESDEEEYRLDEDDE